MIVELKIRRDCSRNDDDWLGSLNGTIDVKCNGIYAVASIYWLPVEEWGLNYDELSQESDQSEI